jgi:hypothetical protein
MFLSENPSSQYYAISIYKSFRYVTFSIKHIALTPDENLLSLYFHEGKNYM